MERIKDLKEYDNKDQYKTRFNYKMTDIQAAMGITQLSRLPEFIRRRREIAGIYENAFKKLDVQLPACDSGHIYYRYVIDSQSDAGKWIASLARLGIGCARPVYRPLHRYLKCKGYPETERAWRQSLSIPIYPSLSRAEIDWVTQCISKHYYNERSNT